MKKNSTVLRSFNSWLAEASDDTLAACPTLIIDDESDQASVNTNRPEEDPTSINDHIRNMIKKFGIVSYVGYTATPFANVLIDASTEDDLFPRNFLVCLDRPVGYVGAEELFGRDAIEPKGALQGLPVIRTVPDSESVQHAQMRADADNSEQIVTPSMLKALDSFILGCSARLARNQWKQHMTMLIHTSHLISRHASMKDALDNHVLTMKLDRKDESPALKARLESLWKQDFLAVSTQFRAAKIPEFTQIWRNSEKFIERLEVVLENSTSEERLTYDRTDPFWGIVVGGNTLSRGLTLEGLTTSYFVRGSRGYDTLLQMGRWFGYRPDYVDLTRIFVTQDLQSRFYHLATVEQEIRDEISTMAANSERPIDVGLRIRTHPSMTITSNLKMRTAQTSYLTYSGSKVQALYMNLDDVALLNRNAKAVRQLLESVESTPIPPSPPGFEDLSFSLLYKDVNPELILQFLDRYEFSRANIRFTASMISEYIQDLRKVGELTKWSVAIMSPKSGSSIELPMGRRVFRVDRSVVKLASSELDPAAKHIKVITTPRDELVDMRDLFKDPAIRNSEDVFKVFQGQSEVYFRQHLRPEDRGLLLLYVLNPHAEITDDGRRVHLESPSQTMPVTAAGDSFAVAFVFPKTAHSTSKHQYIVNGTV